MLNSKLTTQMCIVWLNRTAGGDVPVTAAEIGGKAVRLRRLAAAGFPVPAGFCVPADDMDRLDAREIEAATSQLGAESVVVRSSAVEEDGCVTSFAGIYTSHLNVSSIQDIMKALHTVRASAFSPAAAAYRKKRGIHGAARMAGIVQQFLKAEASGVLFMKDPVAGSRLIIIEGSWGLGEAVVEGRVTPDRWILSRQGELVRCEIADKDIAIVPGAQGTREVALDPDRRHLPCLTETSLRQLFDLATRCEELFGIPQDIEWALVADKVWLLQSRPITGP